MHSSNLWRIIQLWASWIFLNEQSTSMWLAYWALRVKWNGPTQVKEPLSPCSPAPLSTDVNHQGSGERIKGKVLQGNSQHWLKPEAKKHEQGCLQSAPGDCLGPRYSMMSPEPGAASEHSGALPQHGWTSLREGGQTFVSSSPSTGDESSWLSCFKGWAISKAVSTGFPKFCYF